MAEQAQEKVSPAACAPQGYYKGRGMQWAEPLGVPHKARNSNPSRIAAQKTEAESTFAVFGQQIVSFKRTTGFVRKP